MNLEQLSYLAQIVGVIAVVASLGYVSIQLKQNTNALQAQTRQGILHSSQAVIQAIIDQPEIQLSAKKFESLTEEEQVRIASFLSMALRGSEFSWLQHRSGVMDEAQWETEKGLVAGILSAEPYRVWWEALGRALFSSEFVSFVEEVIVETPINNELLSLHWSWANSPSTH